MVLVGLTPPEVTKHQVLDDQPAVIVEPLGKLRRLGVEQDARRAHTITGHDNDFRLLELLIAIRNRSGSRSHDPTFSYFESARWYETPCC